MERISRHMITGLIGLTSLSSGSELYGASFWVNAGYDNSHLNMYGLTLSNTQVEAAMTSTTPENAALRAATMEQLETTSDGHTVVPSLLCTDSSGAYIGLQAELQPSDNVQIGAHVDFTQQKQFFMGMLEPEQSTLRLNMALSPKVGVYSVYRWNEASFSLGLDFSKLSLNERTSIPSYYYMNKTASQFWLAQLVVGTSTNISPYTRASLDVYYGLPNQMRDNEGVHNLASPLTFALSNSSSFQSGFKISVSQNISALSAII